MFDVRFLPNPYYIEDCRSQSGNDKGVRDYVMDNEKAVEFLKKLVDMVKFLIPNYIAEGKTQLVIAIGCTGGKSRSVTLANALYEAINCQEQYGVRVEHRDIKKNCSDQGEVGGKRCRFQERSNKNYVNIMRRRTLQPCRAVSNRPCVRRIFRG